MVDKNESIRRIKQLERGLPLKTPKGTKIAPVSKAEDLKFKLNRRNATQGIKEEDL